MHENPQLVPSQVGPAFAGGVHAVHDDGPQEFTLALETHTPPQLWKPVLQVKPQLVPSQVGSAFAGAEHGVQDGPHELRLAFETQALLQAWFPDGQVEQTAPEQYAEVQSCATRHCLPAAQGEQLPPQSTAVSSPSLTESVQLAGFSVVKRQL